MQFFEAYRIVQNALKSGEEVKVEVKTQLGSYGVFVNDEVIVDGYGEQKSSKSPATALKIAMNTGAKTIIFCADPSFVAPLPAALKARKRPQKRKAPALNLDAFDDPMLDGYLWTIATKFIEHSGNFYQLVVLGRRDDADQPIYAVERLLIDKNGEPKPQPQRASKGLRSLMEPFEAEVIRKLNSGELTRTMDFSSDDVINQVQQLPAPPPAD